MDIGTLMQKKMTRKQFLASIGGILIGIFILKRTDLISFYDETEDDLRNAIKVINTNE